MSEVRFKYQTIEFDNIDIHVRTLKDTQQFCDKDNEAEKLGVSPATWSLFGVIWPSGKILANYMLKQDTSSKTILEIGCGIGLSSLLLNHLNRNITATDYHPEAGRYLQKNAQLNEDKEIPFFRSGWGDEKDKSIGRFDLIIGSDILFQPDHIEQLSHFINEYADDACEVVIVDPNRGYRSKFTKKMIEFGYEHEKVEATEYSKEPYKGAIHRYTRNKAKAADMSGE